MNLYQLENSFSTLTREHKINLIKSYRQRRYELATQPKARPRSVATKQKQSKQMLSEFHSLPKALQDKLLSTLERKIRK